MAAALAWRFNGANGGSHGGADLVGAPFGPGRRGSELVVDSGRQHVALRVFLQLQSLLP